MKDSNTFFMKKTKWFIVSSVILCQLSVQIRAQSVEGEKGVDNPANRYMNRVDVDRLIDHFESPSRAGWQKPYEVIGLFGDLNGKTIMDLGAGSGYFTFRLAAEGAHVIAADVNEEFQEFIRKKKSEDEFRDIAPNIELRKVPYDDPQLGKDEADGVLIVNAYHHLDDRISYMKKVREGLKSRGKLIIVDYKKDVDFGPPAPHKLAMEIVVNEIKLAGFTNPEINTGLLPYQYVIIGIK